MLILGKIGELVKTVTVEAPLVPVTVGPAVVVLLDGTPYPPYPPPVLVAAVTEKVDVL